MIQGTVADGDTTPNIDWVPITAEQLAELSVNMVLLGNLLKKYQSGGNKVLIFSQMVCVLNFIDDMLRVK